MTGKKPARRQAYHVSLLPEGPGADLTHEGLLPGVNLEMLLEVEPFGVDEQATHGTAFVVRPADHKKIEEPGKKRRHL